MERSYPQYYTALRSERAMPTAIATILSWLMHSDGDISNAEAAYLDAFRSQQGVEDALMWEIAHIGSNAATHELRLALELIHRFLAADARWLLLDLILGMILVDGKIHLSEKVILELLVDALHISRADFLRHFREIVGKEYAPTGDPSSAHWWSAQEKQQSKSNQQKQEEDQAWEERERKEKEEQQRERSRQSAGKGSSINRIKALATLGLEEDATMADIQNAYRRLAMVHHPDRFQNLGPEAQKAAHETFIRIQNAYELLRAA